MKIFALVANAGAGCGRVGFEPIGSSVDATPVDAAPGPFVPSNTLPPELLDDVTGTFDDPGPTITINTDTGEVRAGASVVRAAGGGVIDGVRFEAVGSLGVFGVASWSIASGTTVRGFGTRALVVLSRGDVSILGLVDVSGGMCSDGRVDPTCGGPGGGAGSLTSAGGCGPGGNGAGGNEPGGGGGGMGEPGAPGGALPPGAGGLDGDCPPVTLVPLVGGSGGGHGGSNAGLPIGAGGGGGGAIQVSSYRSIRIEGLGISAGGVGGRGGSGEGGGGGGSGGAILLEAPSIDLVTGTLAANGGGGGEGNDDAAGAPGALDAVPSPGGITGGGICPGGNGGARGSPPTAGTGAIDAGGGGGGVGRIRINASANTTLSSFVISPIETTSTL